MPIYDYVCGSCGHRFEVLRGINEAGPHQCPECGGPVARAFVPPTIHFKGSGWAKTDRRATSAPARRADPGSPAHEARESASGGESGTSSEAGTSSESPATGAGGDAATGASAPSKPASSDSTAERR